ncbi:MAG: LexA family protein, partial [Coriobacteriales bacterium]
GQSLDMLPITEFVDINEQLLAAFPQAFFLRVNGESMNRVLPNGCLALIDPLQREPLSGAIFALRVDASEATVKRLRLEGSTLTLLPCSTDPSFEETELSWTAESQASVQILGRVVWYCLPPDERL